MGKKKVLVCYGVDIDAVAGWLGSYGGEDSTSDISRGLWAGTIGTRRLLKLFEKYNIKASWFIPGHSLETFPEECAMVRDAGHEIGLHGWTKIDYSQKAEEWMKPLVKGKETGLVEIPGSWYIDDLPPMMFMKNSANSHGWVNPRDVEDIWRDHFDYFYREYDEFIFPMTIHPDVSGRPHVLLMHERIIEHINSHEGVEWVTMGEMSDYFKSKNPAPEGGLMPASQEEVMKKYEEWKKTQS
ncbi:polysaccharide deacetylase [Colletotrichum salicis]|uniref:Polysaccharide deacetylase n=1 Tax=Colletotrichum salicis TaxID=1209931 RepID=A0A135V645_9PEZI|nr:polysaccharide deacetylase [Colletotrichum salicis]